MLRDIMDLHTVSVKYTDRRNHCITKAKTLGIEYYIEKSFNLYKTHDTTICN